MSSCATVRPSPCPGDALAGDDVPDDKALVGKGVEPRVAGARDGAVVAPRAPRSRRTSPVGAIRVDQNSAVSWLRIVIRRGFEEVLHALWREAMDRPWFRDAGARRVRRQGTRRGW